MSLHNVALVSDQMVRCVNARHTSHMRMAGCATHLRVCWWNWRKWL